MSTFGSKSSGPILAIALAVSLLFLLSGRGREEGVDGVKLLIEQGQYEQALSELESIEVQWGGDSNEVVSKTICLVALGEHPKAVQTLQTGITDFPKEHRLTVILADIYLSLGQPRLAKIVLGEARERGAPDELISVPLAICLGEKGDYTQALVELERAERDGASLTDVGYNKSLILLEEGRADEAMDILEAVLEQSGEHLAALREHARALVMTSNGEDDERLERAISQVNRVLNIQGDDWRAYEVLGDAFLAQADPVAAVGAYTEALRYGGEVSQVGKKYRAAAERAGLLLEDGAELDRRSLERSPRRYSDEESL